MKSCSNCIWNDVCDHAEVCDNYDPSTDDGVDFYESDLAERSEVYQQQVEEQDA